ncbi:MAG: hypothetical protein K2O91_07540 [Lachnospiraceae bacterium]|nr:hypothetical protein [Lachnospiraceae bacterium]
MGSLIAPFDDKGVLQTHTTSGDSLTSKSGKNKNTVDSDMFLTLLVAEMQNQDPLEPTSNTEWVSQYATFTQVQKMSEMAESIDVLRANELIGKEVIMKTTSTSTGEVNYTQGIVDFVEMENGKPLLVIDDAKYSISDLDTIVSSQYSAAYEKYSTFKEMIDALPDVAFANRTYENVIQGAFDYYNTMDEYQKNYMKIYGSAQMEKFTEWKLELENMGIEFKDSSVEEDEKKTSLDDILESFNTKMNAILDKLNLLAENKETVDKNTDQSNTDTAGKTDEITNDKNNESNTGKTDEVTGGQTDGDNTGKTDETTGNKTEENNTDKTDETTGGQTTEDTTDKTEENTGDQSGESGTE